MIEESDSAWLGCSASNRNSIRIQPGGVGHLRGGEPDQPRRAQHVPLPAAPGDAPATFEQEAVARMKPLGGAELQRVRQR